LRAKANLQFQRRYSHPVDKSTGVRSDKTIMLTGPKSSQLYPTALRRVSYYSAEMDKVSSILQALGLQIMIAPKKRKMKRAA